MGGLHSVSGESYTDLANSSLLCLRNDKLANKCASTLAARRPNGVSGSSALLPPPLLHRGILHTKLLMLAHVEASQPVLPADVRTLPDVLPKLCAVNVMDAATNRAPRLCPTTPLASPASNDTPSLTVPTPTTAVITTDPDDPTPPAPTLHTTPVSDIHTVEAQALRPTRALNDPATIPS